MKIKTLILAKLLALFMLVFIALPALATDTWNFYFPIVITDNSGVARSNIPILAGANFTGNAFYSGGFMSANGTDTRMKAGGADTSYMMSTTQVPLIVSSLPAYSSVTYQLYTGYTPLQSTFPIIVGNNGYITIPDAAPEPSSNFTLTYNGYVDTGAYSQNIIFKQGAYKTWVPSSGTVQTLIGTSSFATVATTNSGTDASRTSHTVNLPSGILSGHLLIVIFTEIGNSTITFPAGWTSLFTQTGQGSTPTLTARYRVADGTEGSTITVSTGSSVATSHISYRITGYSGTPEVGSATVGGDSSPDPASLSASWGYWNNLWLAIEGASGAVSLSSYPSGFGSGLNAGGGTCLTASARLNSTEAAVDSGAFTNSTPSYWVANTIVIKPALTTLSVLGLYSSEKTITITSDSSHVWMTVDGVASSNETAVVVLDNNSNWLLMSGVTPYMTYYKHAVGGTQKIWYQPTVMLTGTTLTDRLGTQDGVITWGANSGVAITYGAVVGNVSTSSTQGTTGLGFTAKAMPMPEQWFASGSAMASFLLPAIQQATNSTGGNPQTLYYMLVLGMALALGIYVASKTRGAVFGFTVAIAILWFGMSGTIVPGWIIFGGAVTGISILYLARQYG